MDIKVSKLDYQVKITGFLTVIGSLLGPISGHHHFYCMRSIISRHQLKNVDARYLIYAITVSPGAHVTHGWGYKIMNGVFFQGDNIKVTGMLSTSF